MKIRFVSRFVAACISCALALPASSRAVNRIVAIGPLPGLTDSFNPSISADGLTVVGVSGATSATRTAFQWTLANGMRKLEMPSDFATGWTSRATDVSADGRTIVGLYSEGAETITPTHIFRWTASDASGTTGVATRIVNPSPGFDIWDSHVSGDGAIIAAYGRATNGNTLPLRWTAATGLQQMNSNGSPMTDDVNNISQDGQTIVGDSYRWTAADGRVALPRLYPDGVTTVADVSADGSVVAGYTAIPMSLSDREGVIWRTGSAPSGIGDLPGGTRRSEIRAISPDGTIAMGLGSGAHTFDAFIWDQAHGIRDLGAVLSSAGIDMSGWTLEQATGISANNDVIVGNGRDPFGRFTAFVAYIPEPSVATALLTAMSVMSTVRRSRISS